MQGSWLLPAIMSALLVSNAALAQQSQSEETKQTNPQSSAGTTVKQPAGVAKPATMERDTQGVTGAKTGCTSASAKMTNGAEETCKQ